MAEQQQARAGDADAYYQVGATAALSTLYGATVEGRTLGALSQGRRAVAAMENARNREPGLHEAALVLGMSGTPFRRCPGRFGCLPGWPGCPAIERQDWH